MAPRIPAFGEAVQHDDRRSRARASDAEGESALEFDFLEAPGFGHLNLNEKGCGTFCTAAF
jgi:hypothetical protein